MILKAVLLTISSVLIGSFYYLSPIVKPLPILTGPYQVGIQTLQFIDQKRIELFSEDAAFKRTLVLHLWYPIPNALYLKKAYYLEGKMPIFQQIFADVYHTSLWISKILWCTIKANAYSNVPLSQARKTYPIILFSHGLLGLPSDMYVSLLENLASHGYIVIGIDHPYFNMLTQYVDGTTVSSIALSAQFQKLSPQEQKEFQQKAIDIYKADIQFVLDQLAKLNRTKESIFYKRFDLNHIGILGHSAGGTAAIEVCRIDDRCKAVINLDGWYDHVIGHEPLQQPLLLLFGSKSVEVTEPTPEYLQRKKLTREQYFEREKSIEKHIKELCTSENCSMEIIPDVAHEDFSDSILLKWPLRAWNTAETYKTLTKINDSILQFFDTYLKSKD